MLYRYSTIFLLCLLALANPVYADVVTDWNSVTLNAIKVDKTSPPRAARVLAMVHTAIYDAVNAIDRTHTSYHIDVTAPDSASPEAAAATAAHQVLAQLFPTQLSTFDTALITSLSSVPGGQAKDDGISLGKAVGDEILIWRATDHSSDIVLYTPGGNPGDWRPTPPGNAPALLPNWPYVTPFAMTDGSQFRYDGPPDLTSSEYAESFNEVKSLGAKDSLTRTADQTEIALFWADGSGTTTPPGHWNQIAQNVAAAQGNTLFENARLFALLNIAEADAAIAAWDCKYAFNLWRPITAIREADTDGNPLTQVDPAWEPLITTPPFPESVSGHSTFSGAAARMLALFYSTDNIAFSNTSDGMPGVTRSYNSFTQAAFEAGRSRIYGGIHFEFSDFSAIMMGQNLSDYAFNNYLQPAPVIPEFPSVILAMTGMIGLVSMLRRTKQ